MEQNKSRLNSLLSLEKSKLSNIPSGNEGPIRRRVDRPAETTTNSELESTPITSPENMELTKRRFARMLSKNPLATSVSTDDNSRPRVGRKPGGLFHDSDVHEKENLRTPLKSTRRLLVQDPQNTLYGADDINRKSINQRANLSDNYTSSNFNGPNATAYVPSTSKKKKVQYRQQRYRDEYRDYQEEVLHYDNEEDNFEMDLKNVREVDSNLSHKVNRLLHSRDAVGVAAELQAALEDLRIIGVSTLQLWVREGDSLWTVRPADRSRLVVALGPVQQSVFQFCDDYQPTSAACSSVFTLKSLSAAESDEDEEERLLYRREKDLRFSTLREFLSRYRGDSYDSSEVECQAIHTIVLPSRDGTAGVGGYLVATEIGAPSLPFTSSGKKRGPNLLALRRFTTFQMLQRLSAAAAERLAALSAGDEHRDVSMRTLRLEEAAASHEALRACDSLLSSESFNRPPFIAAAVAKSGSFNEQYAVKLSWVLVQEKGDHDSLFSETQHSADRSSVLVFAGGKSSRADLTSDILTVGRHSSLVDSLMSNRAGVVPSVTVPELRDSSMLSADQDLGGQTLSLLFVPVVFKSGLDIAVTVVIALSPDSSQDTVLAHAKSLASMAGAALDRVHSQRRQQQLDGQTQAASLLHSRPGETEGTDAELTYLLSAVQSESVADLLGVHRASLLLSQQLGAEFPALTHASSANAPLLKYEGTSLREAGSSGMETFAWFHELQSGKVVFYTPHEDSSSPAPGRLSASAKGHSVFDATSRSAGALSSSYAALQHVVGHSSTSAMLVPLKTDAGLCVLVLSDRVLHTVAHEKVSVPFSSPFVTSLLSSTVCDVLLHQLNTIHSTKSLTNSLAQEAAEKQRLLAALAEGRYANVVHKWHRVVKSALDKSTEREYATKYSTLLEMVTHRQALDSTHEERTSFILCVQKQLAQVFPADVVITSVSPFPAESRSYSFSHESSEDFESQTSSLRISGTIVDHYRTPAYGSSSKSSSHSEEGAVVGYVRVCRSSKSKHVFTQREARALKRFCDTAGDVYSSLHRGLSRDYIDGDARGLLLPMLAQLAPALLGSSDLKRMESLRPQLPSMINWLKRVCRADMVTLRLSQQDASELLLSSDDVEVKAHTKAPVVSMSPFVAVSTHTSSGGDGEEGFNQVSVKLISREAEDGPPLGEIKVFGGKTSAISPEQSTAVSLVAYLLAQAMSAHHKSAEHGSVISDSYQVMQKLEGMVEQEREASERLRDKLSELLGVALFMAQLTGATSPAHLSALVNEHLTQLLGASSAVLLLTKKGIASAGSGWESDDLSVILPTGQTRHSADSQVSRVQLSQLPSYFKNSSASQSKIELVSPSLGSVPFGAILVFRNAALKVKETAPFDGLDEVMTAFFSSIVLQISVRHESLQQNDQLARLLSASQAAAEGKQQMESDLRTALEISESLETQRGQLQSELAALKQRLEEQLDEKSALLQRLEEEVGSIRAKKESMGDRLGDRIKGLESDLLVEKNRFQAAAHTKNQLLEMLSSFSFDHRCQQETIVQWLTDVAESKDVSLLSMAQSESGLLAGGNGIRGILAAAGECIRTGSTVELVTSYQATGEDKSGDETPSPVGGRYGHSGMRFDSRSSSMVLSRGHDSPPHSAETISILCVPNRCAAPQTANEHACFVFVRSITPLEEGKFSADDKDVLNCAVDLTCRTLSKPVVKYSAADFKGLQTALDRQAHLTAALRRSVALSAEVREKDYQSRSDVASKVVEGVCELLTRGANDCCFVEAEMLFAPWNSGGYVLNPDRDIIDKVTTTCRTYIRNSLMWVPLVDRRETVAILRCERKFRSDGQSTEPLSPRDILMTELDDEVVAIFGDLAVPLLNRVQLLADTLVGVKQAGQAIVALQKVHSALEDRCAVEVGNRLKLEESLKAGADMLGTACAHRVVTGQLIDAAKKAVLSITSAFECVIVLPASANHSFLRDVEFDEADRESREGAFFTMTSDRSQATLVRFEPGDMEVAAMQSLRCVATRIEGEAEPTLPWQSWAVRRLLGELAYRSLVESSGSEEIFSMSVPIVLQGGARAVMTAIRRGVPFTSSDREGMSWLGRVLAYCLDLRGGDELRETTKLLEAEVGTLKHVRGVNEHLERDLLALEKDLHDIPLTRAGAQHFDAFGSRLESEAVDRQGIDIVVDCAQASFGQSAQVESWSAAEAVENFGVILPTESFSADGKSVAKDSMVAESGKITFWIDSAGDLYEGLDFFRSGSGGASRHHSPAHRDDRKQQQQQHGKFSSAGSASLERVQSNAVLYIVVQMRGYPVCWVKVSTLHSVARNHKLRLALMLKLLENHGEWRSKYLQVIAATAERETIVEQVTAAHKEEAIALRADCLAQVTACTGQHRLAERITFESIFACSRLRRDFAKARLPVADMGQWVQPIIVNACKALESSSGCSVSAVFCPNGKAAEDAGSSVHWLSTPSCESARTLGESVLQQALSSDKILLFLSAHHNNDSTREALSTLVNDLESLHLHAKVEVLFVTATEHFPPGTLVTPVPLPSVKSTLVTITKPVSSALIDSASFVSGPVLGAWIVAWISLRTCLQSVMPEYAKHFAGNELAKRVARVSLKRTFDRVDAQQLTLSLAFERMKSLRLVKQLRVAEGVQGRCDEAVAQLHIHEQQVADWEEIVRGMTGAAASAITSGVQGLWAQSCSALLSMMSSHLTVTGCGLILHTVNSSTGAPELVEFCVRELTTPMAALNTTRGDDDPHREGAADVRGMLENRPASDLGQKVVGVVNDILAGAGGNQRIFKLTRPRAYPGQMNRGAEDSEHLWLVPVMTARSVLAVLRVSVDLPSEPMQALPLSPIPKTHPDRPNKSFAAEKYTPQQLAKAAQSNLVNFAEVLAPVFAVTLQLDKRRRQHEALDQAMRKQTNTVNDATEKLTEAQKNVTLLQTALGVLNKVFTSELAAKSTVKGSLKSLTDIAGATLSEVLSCRVSIHVNGSAGLAQLGFTHEGAEETSSGRSAEGKSRRAIQHSLVDQLGDTFGSIVFEGAKEQSEDIRQLTFEGAASASVGFDLVARALASVVAGRLVNYTRETSNRMKMASLRDNVLSCEQSVEECRGRMDSMAASCDFYRTLADVVNQCLVFTTLPQTREADSLADSGQLIELLRGLTATLPGMMGGACLFNFAVADNSATVDADGREEGVKILHWVYGNGAEEGSAGAFSAAAAHYLKLNEGVREISTNLAHSCIQRRAKSSFDIGTGASLQNQVTMSMHLSTTAQLKLSSVRILTFPLLLSNRSTRALGAMQVMLELSSPEDTGDADSFCEDVARAISCAMSHALHSQHLHAELNELELNAIVINSRVSEEVGLKETWQQRCAAWRSVALASSEIARGISGEGESERLSDVLFSPAVASTLHLSGVALQRRAPSSSGVLSSASFNPGTVATALVPLNEASESLAEVSCSELPSSDSLKAIGTELVEALSEVVRAGVRLSSRKAAGQVEVERSKASAGQKVEKLKASLRQAKEELSETVAKQSEASYDLMCQTERYESLRAHASSAVTSLCLPAISELVALLLDLNRGSGEESMLEWAWNGFARVASRAVGRMSNGGFAHHVSVLARCTDAKSEGAALLKVYDGSEHHSGIHSIKSSAHLDGSVVEKCLRLGGIHESSGEAVQPVDLTGINTHLLSSTFAKSKSAAEMKVLCVALHNAHQEVVGVVRIVHRELSPEASAGAAGVAKSEVVEQFTLSLLRPVVEMVSALGGALVQASAQQINRAAEVEDVLQGREKDAKRAADMQDQLAKARQMCKVVCREASALLDAPVVNTTGAAPRAVHPANLTPLAASQDTCLKLLSVVRTLLRSEGQALLLRDPATEPTTYQVIYTGDSLRWPGIEQASFGVVSSPPHGGGNHRSLAETAMHSRKAVQTADAPNDSRYSSFLDGICTLGTPVLAVPLKGRGGAIVGALIVAKARDSAAFSAEDVTAAELSCCLGSLSLYWCQGLGSLHHQLNKQVRKMDNLEKVVRKLSAERNDD